MEDVFRWAREARCWVRRCCCGEKEEQEEEDKGGPEAREKEEEEVKMRELCLRKSRSSTSLPPAVVCENTERTFTQVEPLTSNFISCSRQVH